MDLHLRTQRLLFWGYVVSLPLSMSGLEITSSLLVFSTLAYIVRTKHFSGFRIPFWRPMAVFTVIVVVSGLVSGTSFEAIVSDVGKSRFFVIYACLFLHMTVIEKDMPWLNTLFFIAGGVGVFSIFQHFFGSELLPGVTRSARFAMKNGEHFYRVCGFFSNPLYYANCFSFLAILAFAIGAFKRKQRWLLWSISAIIAVSIVLTASRAAWVALPIALIIVAFPMVRLKIVPIVLLLLILMIFVFRSNPLISGRSVTDLGSRQALWGVNLIMFREHPLLGVGYLNNARLCETYMNQYFPDDPWKLCANAHSNLLQVAAGLGILGLAAFLWLWWEVFAKLLFYLQKFSKDSLDYWLARGLFAGFVSFHIQGLTEFSFGDSIILHMMSFCLALTAALSKR